MSVKLETMSVQTSASGFDRLSCIKATITKEELEKLD